jgi:hypothetical protein
MRFVFALLLAMVAATASAAGPTVIVTAQDRATIIARRGVLVHSGCGRYEGIGYGSTPEAARRNCCYYGRRPIVEEGVAYSPARRQWFAVIRYR